MNGKKIINYTKKKKFKVYVDVFGLKALEIFKGIDVDGFKIRSSDLCNSKILEIVNKLKKKYFYLVEEQMDLKFLMH